MDSFGLFCTGALLACGLYWFVCLLGPAKQKGKHAVDLSGGSISSDKEWGWGQSFHFSPSICGKSHRDATRLHEEMAVDLIEVKPVDRILDVGCGVGGPMRAIAAHSRANVVGITINEQPKEIETAEKVPDFVDTFYNLVTDIYEWGWGQSFHFSPSIRGKSHRDATRLHEEMVVDLIEVKPGDRILDVGCGVESRARFALRVVCGNFLEMSFKDSSFDGAYSIEATCHAPKLEDVYAEVFRVLKPGSLYVSYEWVTTGKYIAENPEHMEVIQGIERGDALPGLRSYKDIAEIANKVGFEVVKEEDLAKPSALPWWTRLKVGRITYWRNHLLVTLLASIGIAPKGTVDVHDMLFKTADYLTRGGDSEIFSIMHMILLRKPHVSPSISQSFFQVISFHYPF
ncbi:24-methylenesterol C-methyltransferase 2 [Hibiscus syriacus]|uniref:Methyltransferase n=1 Tax=Hibiscus syriacus TaxID=106335 RepID=A0A6A2ZZG5_HIBSY|nr:24-methylenesterol C-methyltransferase 2 [Hibiscus syriacus]